MTERIQTQQVRPDAGSDEAQRCPECSARRAPNAPWCTQCFHRFTPVNANGSATGSANGSANGTDVTLTAEAVALEESSWDERYRSAASELDEEARQAKVEELMARLQTSEGPALTGRMGRLTAFTSTVGGKVALIAGGIFVLSSLGLLAMWVLGHLI